MYYLLFNFIEFYQDDLGEYIFSVIVDAKEWNCFVEINEKNKGNMKVNLVTKKVIDSILKRGFKSKEEAQEYIEEFLENFKDPAEAYLYKKGVEGYRLQAIVLT